jgi:hypothetical protein
MCLSAWRLIENERFPELYFSSACIGKTENGFIFNQIPYDFQIHFNHEVMNSLGTPKVPTEQIIHINHMIDSTRSKSKKELIDWLQRHLPEFQALHSFKLPFSFKP